MENLHSILAQKIYKVTVLFPSSLTLFSCIVLFTSLVNAGMKKTQSHIGDQMASECIREQICTEGRIYKKIMEELENFCEAKNFLFGDQFLKPKILLNLVSEQP